MKAYDKTYKYENEIQARKRMLTMRKKRQQEYPGMRLGWTAMSDRLPHELRKNIALHSGMHKTIERTKTKSNFRKVKGHLRHLPPIDWRKHEGKKFVSSVKDQGDCGCCFAFASAGVLEFWSVHNQPHRVVPSISAQELSDCTSQTGENMGCDGGLMEFIFERYKSHGVALEREIPFQEQQQPCPTTPVHSTVAVHDYDVLMIDDEPETERMMEHLLHRYGPISVGIDTDNDYIQDYTGGIFPAEACGTEVDHAMLVVGYTEDSWILKNSWSPYWGEDGYLRIEKGKNACGIAEYVAYVKSASVEHNIKKTP